MKDMKRALRRHHATRLGKARHFHWGRDIRNEAKYIGIAINTPCTCSCWMCGNPRRHLNEVTLQEKIADLDQKQNAEGIDNQD